MKTTHLLGGALALAMAAIAAPAAAEYPEKPVSFIVPWPPGDLEDVLTRMIAEDFAAEYGVSAAVVNKPGGGGGPFPGAIDVATAPADGYTIGSFVPAVPVIGHEIGIDELTPGEVRPDRHLPHLPLRHRHLAAMRPIRPWTSLPPMPWRTTWRWAISATC